MKPLSYAFLAAAAACGLASAAETAYTTPVGYVNVGDTTIGEPACKANTDVFLSIPLLKAADYAGTVASISGDTITLSGTPGFTGGQFASPTDPYYAVIGSGAKSGLVAVVSANGVGDVTVMLQPGDSLSGVVAGDAITIRKAWTVRSLMGTSLPSGVSLFTLPSSGPLNPAAELIFDWDGTNWVDNVITGAPADDTILFPGETLILRNSTATPIATITVTGEVNTAKSSIPMDASSGAADYAVSYFSAGTEELGSSGLSAVANPGDSLLGFDNNASGFNKAASAILDFDGTDWVDNVITGSPYNEFPVGAGQGFIFRRGSAHAAATWSDEATYIPSL